MMQLNLLTLRLQSVSLQSLHTRQVKKTGQARDGLAHRWFRTIIGGMDYSEIRLSLALSSETSLELAALILIFSLF